MTAVEHVAGGVPRFSVEVEPHREVVRVVPAGELDLATVPVLDREVQALLDVGFGDVIIDLRDLSFVDVSGVRLLLCLTDQARGEGWRLSLIAGDDPVTRVCALTGVSERLPFRAAKPL